jgi:Asp-tRNA(Asn)/Glu-tRNA(Gln) amidotransferase A subunit family amidase
VSLPIAEVGGCPLGLGIIGPRGSDEDLLRLAGCILELLGHPAADARPS